MTKFQRISIFYLLIISTISVIFNSVLLIKKNHPLVQPNPVQTEKTIINSDFNPETKSASETATVAQELAAIHAELSQIRAIQRSQNQTLGSADTEFDTESLLTDTNASTTPTLSSTPTPKVSPTVGFITLRSAASADVHQDKSSSSTVIDHIYLGKNYPFLQKIDNWYLVKTQSFRGWVNASLVKETN